MYQLVVVWDLAVIPAAVFRLRVLAQMPVNAMVRPVVSMGSVVSVMLPVAVTHLVTVVLLHLVAMGSTGHYDGECAA